MFFEITLKPIEYLRQFCDFTIGVELVLCWIVYEIYSTILLANLTMI